MKRIFLIAAMQITCGAMLYADTAIEIVAHQQSGNRIVVAVADVCTTSLLIGPSTAEFAIDDPVVRITGLARLPNLVELGIVLFPQITAFDFLRQLVNIRELSISRCWLGDLSFLESLSELRFLTVESCSDGDGGSIIGDDTLDLSHNPKLETISLSGCNIATLPSVIGKPTGLRYVDFSSNDIRITEDDLPALEIYRSVETLVLVGAEVPETILTTFVNIVKSY